MGLYREIRWVMLRPQLYRDLTKCNIQTVKIASLLTSMINIPTTVHYRQSIRTGQFLVLTYIHFFTDLTVHCNESPIYVFQEKELCSLSPNFHIHVSVSNFYVPRIGPCIFSCSRPIWGRAIPSLGICVSNFWYCVFAVYGAQHTVHLKNWSKFTFYFCENVNFLFIQFQKKQYEIGQFLGKFNFFWKR